MGTYGSKYRKNFWWLRSSSYMEYYLCRCLDKSGSDNCIIHVDNYGNGVRVALELDLTI